MSPEDYNDLLSELVFTFIDSLPANSGPTKVLIEKPFFKQRFFTATKDFPGGHEVLTSGTIKLDGEIQDINDWFVVSPDVVKYLECFGNVEINNQVFEITAVDRENHRIKIVRSNGK